MPDVVVCILIAIGILVTGASFMGQFNEVYKFNCIWIISLMLTLDLAGWMVAYQYCDSVIDKEYVITSKTVDGIDIVVTGQNIVNLNKEMGKDIPEGTKIKYTHYKNNYMTPVGIYCLGDTIQDKFEIVDEPKPEIKWGNE